MQQFNIYLSGGMQIFGKDNFDEGNEWRIYCRDILENCDSIYTEDYKDWLYKVERSC